MRVKNFTIYVILIFLSSCHPGKEVQRIPRDLISSLKEAVVVSEMDDYFWYGDFSSTPGLKFKTKLKVDVSYPLMISPLDTTGGRFLAFLGDKFGRSSGWLRIYLIEKDFAGYKATVTDTQLLNRSGVGRYSKQRLDYRDTLVFLSSYKPDFHPKEEWVKEWKKTAIEHIRVPLKRELEFRYGSHYPKRVHVQIREFTLRDPIPTVIYDLGGKGKFFLNWHVDEDDFFYPQSLPMDEHSGKPFSFTEMDTTSHFFKQFQKNKIELIVDLNKGDPVVK